jgi:hypothetical protein
MELAPIIDIVLSCYWFVFEKVDKMFTLFQLLLAVFAIYAALNYEQETRLLVPLGCLVLMLIVNRVDKAALEKKTERQSFLQTEISKVLKKESATIKEQDFFTIDSLLWPKSDLLLIDAVHFIFKDLGFRISAGINYHSVDRIVRIPESMKVFGVEILMSEKEVEKNHPKISRAVQFEKEKREKEKTLIIASTHTHLPLSERNKVSDISNGLGDLLLHNNVSFMSTHQLYGLWQKSKGGEVDIFGIFEKIYSHPGGSLPLEAMETPHPHSFEMSL